MKKIQCELKFLCNKTWDTLHKTNERDVKFCDLCQNNVHYCHSTLEFIDAASKGFCVAYDSENISVKLLSTSTTPNDSIKPIINIGRIRMGLPSSKK